MDSLTVNECYLYAQDRLNKLSTNAGDNISKYSFVLAFNAVQYQWCEDRAKLEETNTIRKDEIKQLLEYTSGKPVFIKDNYYEFKLPTNYFHHVRSTSVVECEIANRLVKEGNINTLVHNENWKPSIEWGETLCTLIGDSLRIYVDNFSISNVNLVYYRYPQKINLNDGHSDINGITTEDIDPEFKGASLIEILNETCQLLAASTADQWNYQTLGQKVMQHT